MIVATVEERDIQESLRIRMGESILFVRNVLYCMGRVGLRGNGSGLVWTLKYF